MAFGNGERYYNPSYGRFIQQDRFAGLPQMPQSLNRFSYTHNNPTKHTDPSGNVIPLVAAVAIVGIIAITGSRASKGYQDAELHNQEQGGEDSKLTSAIYAATYRQVLHRYMEQLQAKTICEEKI